MKIIHNALKSWPNRVRAIHKAKGHHRAQQEVVSIIAFKK